MASQCAQQVAVQPHPEPHGAVASHGGGAQVRGVRRGGQQCAGAARRREELGWVTAGRLVLPHVHAKQLLLTCEGAPDTPHTRACCRARPPTRNIDKAGGLDNYILQTPAAKLESDVGEALRSRMQAELRRQQKRQQAQQQLPPAAAVVAGQ